MNDDSLVHTVDLSHHCSHYTNCTPFKISVSVPFDSWICILLLCTHSTTVLITDLDFDLDNTVNTIYSFVDQHLDISQLFANQKHHLSNLAKTNVFITTFSYYDGSNIPHTKCIFVDLQSNRIKSLVALRHKVVKSIIHKYVDDSSHEVSVTISLETPHSPHIFDILQSLAVSFAMPFVSLIESDESNVIALSARLCSPWALPVSMVYILLFILFCPCLFLPCRQKNLTLRLSLDNYSISYKESFRFVRRQVFPTTCDLDLPTNSSLSLIKSSPDNLKILEYAPDNDSKLLYIQPRALRLFSVLCYTVCLVIFSLAMILVLTQPENAKFDLWAQLGLIDAASIYILTLAQDISALVPLLNHWFKSSRDKLNLNIC